MSTLRISDAPLLPDVNGTEKIPTGGRGDYTISVDQIKDHIFQDVGKELVGLGNVDNTSDLDKPVSTAQQAALNLKADKTYVDTNLELKSDKTNVYTRSETSLALSKKADLVNGVIPENQIPSSFNDVLEFTTTNLPIIGESGKIYVTTDTNKTWRWATNKYVEISGWNPDSVSKSVTLPTYYTKEDGIDPITGVADGAYFNVRSSSDESYIDEYQNVGGSAVVTGKSYPSGAALANIQHNKLKERDADGAHPASAIAYGSGSVGDFLDDQKELNDVSVHTVLSLPTTNLKNLNSALLKDSGLFYYDESKAAENNFGTVINGWVRITGAVLTPKMFGAKADGVTDDRVAIQRMLAMTSVGYRSFDFEGLPYYIGEVTDSLPYVFKLDTIPNLNIRNAIDIRVTNGMSSTGNLYCPVFLFTDCTGLRAEVHVEGDVFLADGYYSGASAVVLESSLVDAENCVIYASIKKGHSAFQTVTAWRLEARPRRPTDPILRHVYVKATTNIGKYGVRLIDSGENMHLTINTHSVSRSLSLVGASNVQAFINSHEQRNFADVLIKAYDNDVKNIYVKLNSINQTDARNPINIEHQNTHDSSKITDVTIDAHITGRTTIKSDGIPLVVIGRSWTRTGAVEIRSATNCVTDNIQLNFTYDSMNPPSLEFPSYANNGGLVEVNFYSHVRETNNFTIKHGNTLRVASAKTPSSQVLKLAFKNAAPSSILCRVTVIGIDDYRVHNFTNTHIRTFLAKLFISSSTGTVEAVGEVTTVLNGTDYGFGFSINEGKLFASSTRSLSSAFTKFELVVEPIIGSNFI